MTKLILVAGVAGWIASGDWLIGACLVMLLLGWVLLPAAEGPPVLALAYTMQWVAITIGLFYTTFTGRQLEATLHSDYRPMVEIGLGCLGALAGGLWLGRYLVDRRGPPAGLRPEHALTFKTIVTAYVVGTAFVGVIQAAAWDYPGLAQGIIALSYMRLGLLYLIFRRLAAQEEWYYVAAMLGAEIALGITGFFAGFREPLIMAVLALLEVFDRRSVRNWVILGTLAVAMGGLGVAWVGVRNEYRYRYSNDPRFAANRSARFDALRTSISDFARQDSRELLNGVDAFVDRMWTVYYPALAVSRVPNVLPHTDGALMRDTLEFVFAPRLFFPNKPEVVSDSVLVRKYSNINVAGAEQNTDIAFGYAAESYIDYGIPVMFVPMVIWAAFIGFAYAIILRQFHHRDIAISVSMIICWMSLYLFERSWAKTIGLGGTMLIYVGGLTFVLDFLWFEKFRGLYAEDEATGPDAGVQPLHFEPHTKS